MGNSKWQMAGWSLFTVYCLLSPPALAEQGELFGLLERMEQSYARVRDYTAVFHKRERIDGDWQPEEVSFLKFQKPFKVYIRWVSGPPEGREALYVEGANGSQVLVHEGRGFSRFFSFLLDPASWRILQESRYPFTEIGIGRLVERIGRDARRAWAKGELRLVDHGRTSARGRAVRQIEGILPRNPAAGYDSYRMIVKIDEVHGLPIQVSLYNWEDVIVGEYGYSELQLNPGLREIDFDPSNPAYHFPRWRISLSDG